MDHPEWGLDSDRSFPPSCLINFCSSAAPEFLWLMKECLKVQVNTWTSSSTLVLSQSQVRPGSALTSHLGEARAVLHPTQVPTTLGAPAGAIPSSTLGGPADSRGGSSCLNRGESAWVSLDHIKPDTEQQKTWAGCPRSGKAREKERRNILKLPVTLKSNLSSWKKILWSLTLC